MAASPTIHSNSPEFLILEIGSPTTKAPFFASVYRPKGLLFNDFVESYACFYHGYKNIIIAGDVNCGLQNDHLESKYFRELVFSLFLHLVDSGTSFHTATCGSWLNIIVTDSDHKIVSFIKSAAPFIAGHDLLQLEYVFDACRYRDRCITLLRNLMTLRSLMRFAPGFLIRVFSSILVVCAAIVLILYWSPLQPHIDRP